MRWVGVPSGIAGKARFRLPPSSGEQRFDARTAGALAIGRMVTAPRIARRVQPADQPGQGELALVLVAMVAGHQQHAAGPRRSGSARPGP